MDAQPESTMVANNLRLVLPASRTKAFVRSACLLVPAAIIGLTSVLLVRNSNFTPTAVSSRLVDYAMVALAIPIGLATLAIGFRGLQWLSISLWPGYVGFKLSTDEIQIKLGWLCVSTYDTKRLETVYLFEQDENEIEEQFEAHLPEAYQRRHFLPKMVHPDAAEPINRMLLRQCNAPESNLALTMQPMVDQWRKQQQQQQQQSIGH